MLKPNQHRDGTFSLRRKFFACVWLVFLGFLSCVQAAHSHATLPAHKAAHVETLHASQDQDTEANCPLCAAMHSTLPVAAHVPFSAPVAFFTRTPGLITRTPEIALGFALCSRPPPSQANS